MNFILLFFLFGGMTKTWGQSITFYNPKKRTIFHEEKLISKRLISTIDINDQIEKIRFIPSNYSLSIQKQENLSNEKVIVKTKQQLLKPVYIERKSFKSIESAKYAIKLYTVTNGLPSSDITAIYERKNGEIWLAFSGGVARVLSNKLMIYSGANGFPDYNILAIKEFNNKLYFGTFGGGLVELDGQKMTQFSIKNGFPSDHILSLEVYKNKLFIGTYSGGLLAFENKREIQKITVPSIKNGGNIITKIKASGDHLYLFSSSGFGVINTEKYQPIKFSNSFQLTDFEINHNTLWFIDEKGTVYKESKNSLLELKLKENFNFNTINFDHSTVLLGHKTGYIEIKNNIALAICSTKNFSGEVSNILVDKIGNKWLSCPLKGIVLVSKTKFQNIEWDGNYNCITKGPGQSLVYENKKSGGIVLNYGNKKVKIEHPKLQNIISITYSSKKKEFWIITNSSILYRIDEKYQLFEVTLSVDRGGVGDITSVNFDQFDRLLISTYNFGLIRKEGDMYVFFHQWFDITGSYDITSHKVSSNRVVETNSTGNLAFFHPNKIVVYAIDEKSSNTKIYTVNEIKRDSFLVCTSKGLYSFYKERFRKINLQATLNQQRIYASYFHANTGNLYLSTRSGLYEYNVKTKKTILYNEEYGLVSSDFSKYSIQELNGKIYWPTTSGIIEFNTQSKKQVLLKTNIDLEIISIKNNDSKELPELKSFHPSKSIELPNAYNSIELIVHNNYWGREAVTNCFYQLDGNKQWIEINKNASIQLQNLNSGQHELRIKVQYPDLMENEQVYFIKIKRAFYEQAWFILICSLILVVFAFLLIKRIQTSDFDKLENYNDGKYIINKTRLLSISCVILLLFADLYLSYSLSNYSINWFLNGFILFLTLFNYTYTHLKIVNFKIVNYLTTLIYLLISLLLMYRCYENYYSPILSVEIGLVVFYSIFIFKNLKRIILFGLGFAFLSITFLYFSKASFENKIIYLSTLTFNFIAVIIQTIIESRNLSKVLFSDRLLQNAQQYVVVYDNFGNVVYLNQSLLHKVKKQEIELLGDKWWNYLIPNESDRKRHLVSIQHLVKNEQTSNFTSWIKTDTEAHLILWKETPIDGNYILAIGDDITKEEEQKLELEKLSLVAKKVTNGVVILNSDHLIEWANDSFIQLMEYPLEEIIGKRPLVFFSGNRFAEIEKIISNSSDKSFDIVQYTKSGTAKDLLVNENVLFDKNGEIEKYILIVTDITERKKEQEKYKFIVDNAADILYTTDHVGNFQFISPNIVDILGYSVEELLNQHFTSLITQEHRSTTIQFYKNQIFNKKKITNLEFEVLLKDGRTKWVAQTVKMLYDGDTFQSAQGVVKIIHQEKIQQIENQKKVELKQRFDHFLFKQSLISAENFKDFDQYLITLFAEIRSIIEIDRVSLWNFQKDYVQCQFANFRFDKHDKLIKSEYPNYYNYLDKDVMLIAEDAQNDPKTAEFSEIYLKPNNIFSVVDIPIRIDGKISSVLTLEETHSIKKRSPEELDFILKICDLIEINSQAFKRLEVEKLIHESETNFRLLNETLKDVFWLFDLKTNQLIYVSPSTQLVFGITPAEYITNPVIWKNYVHEDDLAIVSKAKEQLHNFEDYDIEYRIVVEGEEKWIHERFFVILDEQNNPIKCSGVSSDITASKLASKEIKRLSLVAEKALNGVTICDSDGRMIYANQSYLDMFEISWENMRGKRPRDLFSGSDENLHRVLKVYNEKSENYNLEIFAQTFKGNPIWIELNTTHVINDDGEPIQVEIVNNITERKKSEEVIFSQNKEILASIRYAQRIQNALFTPIDFFKELPFENYIYYQPKDIVGGDFYWAEETKNSYIIAVGDCTGHGVPGAFMTSLAINGLLNAVLNLKLEQPCEILDHLDRYIIHMLKVNEEADAVDDGMDVGIIRIEKHTNKITFSGAARSAFVVAENSIEKIAGSRRSVASKVLKEPFENVKVELKENEVLTLFSDGIVDQFGGQSRKKMGANLLLAFIQKQLHFSIDEQKENLNDFINHYKGDYDQIDDMVLICLKQKV